MCAVLSKEIRVVDPRYKNGKIYKIVSGSTDRVYVGSTVQTLSNRFKTHKHHSTSSRELLKFEDARIELVEKWACIDKLALCEREQFWIDTIENCVNTKRAHCTPEQYREQARKDIHRFRHSNKGQEYLIANKQKRDEYIKEWAMRRVKCGCGADLARVHLAKHYRSKKHVTWATPTDPFAK